MSELKQNYCINVDWLQCYCKTNGEQGEGVYNGQSDTYYVVNSGRQSKLWNVIYIVRRGKPTGLEVATLCMSPRSTVMEHNAASLKLHNRVLYHANYIGVLYDLLSALQLQYVGITRLDLAYDCNYLHGGMRVDSFLMDYMFHAPFCTGHIIRSGSRRVTINATRGGNGATAINAMRWGSPSTDVGAYCYNKSLELLEVKDKPWIREVWESAGLVNAWKKEQWDELEEKDRAKTIGAGETGEFISTPVWRFEISIKGHGKDLLDMSTGELFRLSPQFLDTQRRVEELFYQYAEKVFDFRISTGQTQIKNYEPMQVFESWNHTPLRPIKLNYFADTGRIEKVAANVVDRLTRTYNDMGTVAANSLKECLAFLRYIGGMKANIVKAKKEASLLDSMKGTMFVRSHERLYLEFVRRCWEKRKEIDANVSLDFFESLRIACELETAIDEYNGEQPYYACSDDCPVW